MPDASFRYSARVKGVHSVIQTLSAPGRVVGLLAAIVAVVTDAGLADLLRAGSRLGALESVHVRGTRVSDVGAAAAQRLAHGIKIER